MKCLLRIERSIEIQNSAGHAVQAPKNGSYCAANATLENMRQTTGPDPSFITHELCNYSK